MNSNLTHMHICAHTHTVQSMGAPFKVSSPAVTSSMDVVVEDAGRRWLGWSSPSGWPGLYVWQFHLGLRLLHGFRCLWTFPLLRAWFVHFFVALWLRWSHTLPAVLLVKSLKANLWILLYLEPVSTVAWVLQGSKTPMLCFLLIPKILE